LNGRLLGGIICATVVTVAFFLAHSWYIGVGFSWSNVGAGFALGLIATYSVVFSNPSLIGSLVKPALILAVMMLIAFGMAVPHGALNDSWTKMFSIVLSVAAIGALGGFGFHLGFNLVKR
jgi:hypothetical protein